MTGSKTPVLALAFSRKAILTLAVALVVTAPLAIAEADTIAYESFDYTTGSLAGKDGGDGFSGAWGTNASGSIAVVTPGLAAGDLPTVGNAAYIDPAVAPTGTTTSIRPLSNSFGADGTTTYVSFLAKQTTGNRFFGVSLLNGTTERMLIGSATANANWGMTTPGGGPTAFSTVPKISDDPVLLVLRIDAVAGNDTLRLYVLNDSEESEPAIASATITTHNLGVLNAIRVGAGFRDTTQQTSVTSTGYIDEIRIATTWEDALAIPEPASLGLLLAGGLVMGLRGRQGRDEV